MSAELPRISVVTPSFNQGGYIESTIQSVVAQQDRNLEYIVVDGGSTDETVEVLRRYDDVIHDWVSEPDRGQSDAINKGFARSTGDILCWLNSDDQLERGALAVVRSAFEDPEVDVVVGHCRFRYERSGTERVLRGEFVSRDRLLRYWRGYRMHQPSIFWRRRVYETIGGVNAEEHLLMDVEYWARMAEAGFRFKNVDAVLAIATYHGDAKTGDGYRAVHASLRRYVPRAFGARRYSRRWFALQGVMQMHRTVNAVRRLRRVEDLR